MHDAGQSHRGSLLLCAEALRLSTLRLSDKLHRGSPIVGDWACILYVHRDNKKLSLGFGAKPQYKINALSVINYQKLRSLL